jgi:hypothetical protein
MVDNEFKIIATNEKLYWTRMIFLSEAATTAQAIARLF